MKNIIRCFIYLFIPYLLLSCQIEHTVTETEEDQKFILGGTVENLSGYDITIVNNKGVELHLSEDGSFSFGGTYTSGETFSVSIVTPLDPLELTCEVINSDGAFVDENIFYVTIVCEPVNKEYSIGADIKGLEGGNLMLTLNAATSITVATDGFHQFPGTFTSGSEYAVTVTQQPDSPMQHCDVENGSGTVDLDDVNI